MTFIELAEKVLQEEGRPLSVDEIWSLAKNKGYDKLVGSRGQTPQVSIGAQIYVHMRDRKNSPFIKMGTKPQTFYLRDVSVNEIEKVENEASSRTKSSRQFDYLERDLHPLLSYYAFHYLNLYTKTIHHSKSHKKDYGEWVHPDMVGCYFPIEEWEPEVMEFSKSIGNTSIDLYSFEIKRRLDFSNLRESFFQAVSNSSWANDAYLVSAEISENKEFQSELRRLSQAHGIGIIKLNVTELDESQILLPSEYNEDLNWEMMNKLVKMNSDFRDFINRVRIDLSSKEIRKEKYDKVLPLEELKHLLNTY